MDGSSSSKWKFVGGRLCLDFINTVDGRIEKREKNSFVFGITKDKFSGYDDFVDWALNIGILKNSGAKQLINIYVENEKNAKKILDRAVKLREAVFRIFRFIIEGWDPPETDIEILNSECKAAREKQTLLYRTNKFEWDFEANGNELDSIIWPVALSGAELLISGPLDRIRQCAGENCGWLFLDTSKNRSRQWCDMKDCGNLAKVRRYREKQK